MSNSTANFWEHVRRLWRSYRPALLAYVALALALGALAGWFAAGPTAKIDGDSAPPVAPPDAGAWGKAFPGQVPGQVKKRLADAEQMAKSAKRAVGEVTDQLAEWQTAFPGREPRAAKAELAAVQEELRKLKGGDGGAIPAQLPPETARLLEEIKTDPTLLPLGRLCRQQYPNLDGEELKLRLEGDLDQLSQWRREFPEQTPADLRKRLEAVGQMVPAADLDKAKGALAAWEVAFPDKTPQKVQNALTTAQDKVATTQARLESWSEAFPNLTAAQAATQLKGAKADEEKARAKLLAWQKTFPAQDPKEVKDLVDGAKSKLAQNRAIADMVTARDRLTKELAPWLEAFPGKDAAQVQGLLRDAATAVKAGKADLANWQALFPDGLKQAQETIAKSKQAGRPTPQPAVGLPEALTKELKNAWCVDADGNVRLERMKRLVALGVAASFDKYITGVLAPAAGFVAGAVVEHENDANQEFAKKLRDSLEGGPPGAPPIDRVLALLHDLIESTADKQIYLRLLEKASANDAEGSPLQTVLSELRQQTGKDPADPVRNPFRGDAFFRIQSLLQDADVAKPDSFKDVGGHVDQIRWGMALALKTQREQDEFERDERAAEPFITAIAEVYDGLTKLGKGEPVGAFILTIEEREKKDSGRRPDPGAPGAPSPAEGMLRVLVEMMTPGMRTDLRSKRSALDKDRLPLLLRTLDNIDDQGAVTYLRAEQAIAAHIEKYEKNPRFKEATRPLGKAMKGKVRKIKDILEEKPLGLTP